MGTLEGERPPQLAPFGEGIDLFWEDFDVGQVFHLGSHQISAEEILEFRRRFDPQPFHVDPDNAGRTVFPGLIASGWHSCSIWMRLFVDAVLSHAASLGSPGIDQVAWLQPVRPGDVLSGSVEVISTRPSHGRPDRGLVQVRSELVDQAGAVKMRLTAWELLGRRPTAGGS
jgi:acyl dehydratase